MEEKKSAKLNYSCWNCGKLGHESSCCDVVTGSSQKSKIKLEVRALHKIISPPSPAVMNQRIQLKKERDAAYQAPTIPRRTILNKINETHNFFDVIENEMKAVEKVRIYDIVNQMKVADQIKCKFLGRRQEVASLYVQGKKALKTDRFSGIDSEYFEEKLSEFQQRRMKVWDHAFLCASRVEKASLLTKEFSRLMNIQHQIVARVNAREAHLLSEINADAKEYCINYDQLEKNMQLLGVLTDESLFLQYKIWLEIRMKEIVGKKKEVELKPFVTKVKQLEDDKLELQDQLKLSNPFAALRM